MWFLVPVNAGRWPLSQCMLGGVVVVWFPSLGMLGDVVSVS